MQKITTQNARDIAQFINANSDHPIEIKTRDSLEIIENALYGVTSADFKKVIIFTDDRNEDGKRCANFQEFDANEIVEVSAR